MNNSLTVSRHFARLVWLLLNDAGAFDAQIATLQSLVRVTATAGPVRLQADAWKVLADGSPVPEHFKGAQDLTAQLIGHSITELVIEQGATPADLMCAAKIVASEPVPGDGGRAVLERLSSVGVLTIQAHVAGAPAPQNEEPLTESHMDDFVIENADSLTFVAPIEAQAEMVQTGAPYWDGTNQAQDDGMHSEEQRVDELFASFAELVAVPPATSKQLSGLDRAKTASEAARQLEMITKHVTDSSRKGRADIAADVFFAVAVRERAATDPAIRREYEAAIRRLASRPVLKSVVELLTRQSENYEQYMAVLVRAGEPGVEALVDALISAPTLADRRVYYDALLQLRTGVRTLIHMLGDPRWYVARNAVELLGELRVNEAENELTRMLEHRDDRVRLASAGALAKLGGSAAAKGVLGVLRDASPEARERALEALDTNRDGSVSSLMRAIDKEEDPRVLTAMIAALGQLGTEEAVSKLSDVARTERSLLARRRATPIRVAAVHALGEAQTATAHAQLQLLLRDKEKLIRGAASWVLLARRRDAKPTAAGARAAEAARTPSRARGPLPSAPLPDDFDLG